MAFKMESIQLNKEQFAFEEYLTLTGLTDQEIIESLIKLKPGLVEEIKFIGKQELNDRIQQHFRIIDKDNL